jgi:chromosomal replication initiator protein
MTAAKEYWNLVLVCLQKTLPSTHFNAWFSKLSFVSTENNGVSLVVGTFSKFSQKYIEEKYTQELLEAVNKYYPKVKKLKFVIDEKLSKKEKSKPEKFYDNSQAISFEVDDKHAKEAPKPTFVIDQEPQKISLVSRNNSITGNHLNNLNPKYTFENFVVTHNNELVNSVAKLVSKQPGTQYNPVFLYSGTGLGKTHILQAIGHKTLEYFPKFNIKYITSESFINQYIEAINNRKMKEFNSYYRSVDLLMIDDIQFIAGKEGTQEAFFHIFNILHQQNKQIIVTSDKHPKNLGGMEQRLVSRFEWGLVVDITKPNYEDRRAVILDKIKRSGLSITEEQINIIARRVQTNYRDIEGILNRIQARFQLLPNTVLSPIELDQILGAFKMTSLINIDFKPKINSPEQLIELVARTLNFKPDQILSTSREKSIMLARQICMYLFKQDLDYCFTAIGSVFGKSHSTVIHSVEKVEQELKSDSTIRKYIDTIRNNYPRISHE